MVSLLAERTDQEGKKLGILHFLLVALDRGNSSFFKLLVPFESFSSLLSFFVYGVR